MQYSPVTLGLVIREHEPLCSQIPPSFFMDSDTFLYLPCCGMHIQNASSIFVLWFSDCREQYPPTLCVSMMYLRCKNKEQCRLRSISCATYKVIVPSGPHLAKCRLCWGTFSIPATLVATKHGSKNNTLQSYCKLICIYTARTSRMCWAYQVAFIIPPPPPTLFLFCLHSGIKLTLLHL